MTRRSARNPIHREECAHSAKIPRPPLCIEAGTSLLQIRCLIGHQQRLHLAGHSLLIRQKGKKLLAPILAKKPLHHLQLVWMLARGLKQVQSDLSPNHQLHMCPQLEEHRVLFPDNHLFLPLKALHVIPDLHKVLIRENTIVRQSRQDLIASTGILE